MATIIGGLTSSHIPAVGNAVHNKLFDDPYWKPFFDGYPPIRQWLDRAMLPGECLNALADPKLQRVLDEIHQKPADPWTVESLARIAGQSRTAFATYFKEAVGLTPINYIAGWRAEMARKLLRESNLAIDEIAVQTGYNDTNAFSRAFKRATGSSPGMFRRMSGS